MKLSLPPTYKTILRRLIGCILMALFLFLLIQSSFFYHLTNLNNPYSWPGYWQSELRTIAIELIYIFIIGLVSWDLIWPKPRATLFIGIGLVVLSLDGLTKEFNGTFSFDIEELNIIFTAVAGIGLILRKTWARWLLWIWLALFFFFRFIFWWLIGPV